ncbi:MAG: autotransporter outer membrane beta-barrel domain-containing protein, partial [Synergistaceae bacterium]|nr:autotransporter outer membrane beta-barrel domain-containing protein [Synergistaceae bacterium]
IYAGTDGNYHYSGKNVAGNGDAEKVHDDFAYTAGLRRYYWDIHEDSATGRLAANNNFTADASRVLLQGALTGLANTDHVFAGASMPAVNNLAGRLADGESGFGGEAGYGRVRYETGSWLDFKGFSASVAYVRKSGTSATGAFIEYGDGKYDVFSHVYRYGGVTGGGNSKSVGGGLFHKRELGGGIEAELFVRGGRVDSSFTLTRDPWLRHPEVHSYDTGAAYYGAHIGVSRNIPLKHNASIELYAQGRYTHIDGDSFVTSFGDEVRVDGMDSLRSRVGVKFSRKNTAGTIKAFAGAAWEHEFKGQAAGFLGGDGITNPPSLKGGSLFGELGLQADAGKNTSVNVSTYGYSGAKTGWGITLGLEHRF